MKYYWVEFSNGCAICSRTIRTSKTIKEIEEWVKTWKTLFKADTIHFIQTKEVNKTEWENFIQCFDKKERNFVIKECTL